MKMSTIYGVEPKAPQPTDDVVEEKAVLPEEEEQLTAIYGMDPSDPGYAERMRELRVLKRSDPELFRKIVNMD